MRLHRLWQSAVASCLPGRRRTASVPHLSGSPARPLPAQRPAVPAARSAAWVLQARPAPLAGTTIAQPRLLSLLHYLLDDGWSPPGLGWQTNWQSLPRWAARRATCRHPRPRRRWVREGGCLAVLPLARSPPAGMSQRHPPAPPSWERCPRPPPQLPPTPAARQARRR